MKAVINAAETQIIKIISTIIGCPYPLSEGIEFCKITIIKKALHRLMAAGGRYIGL
jgi:hypothetical protein